MASNKLWKLGHARQQGDNDDDTGLPTIGPVNAVAQYQY